MKKKFARRRCIIYGMLGLSAPVNAGEYSVFRLYNTAFEEKHNKIDEFLNAFYGEDNWQFNSNNFQMKSPLFCRKPSRNACYFRVYKPRVLKNNH